MAVEIPHFKYPFRLIRGAAGTVAPEVVEQDTADEVLDCVEIALLTVVGERVDMPTFGIDPPVFQQQPIDMNIVGAQISAHEPRAEFAAEQHPDELDIRIARVTAEFRSREEGVV
jgi:phage baseplate assembly protein W